MQYAVRSVHLKCAVRSVKCVVCSVQCAVCSVQCAICNVQCTLWNVYLLDCTENWRCPTEGREDVGQLQVKDEAAVLDGQSEQLKPGVKKIFLVIIFAWAYLKFLPFSTVFAAMTSPHLKSCRHFSQWKFLTQRSFWSKNLHELRVFRVTFDEF